MEIRRTDLRNYDPQHIQAVRGETARSIKPNVFKEIPEEVQLALWLTDLIELSPEAQALLKKFGKSGVKADTQVEWLALLEMLEEIRKKLEGKGPAKKGGDGRLNLISLPVMRPPLQEVLPRGGGGRKKGEARGPAAALLDRMIVQAPDGGVRSRLIAELEPLGFHIVDACRGFGVKIIVLGKDERLSELRIHRMALIYKGEKTSDGRFKDDVRGMYFEDRRLVVIGEEQIGVPGRLTSVHEFAHAYDHTFSEKHHRMHHLSTQLWNLFTQSRTAFITAYASTKPAEYFAESVEAYFIPSKSPLLRKHDPRMFEYLSNLFHGV